jgi:hypothetical protein
MAIHSVARAQRTVWWRAKPRRTRRWPRLDAVVDPSEGVLAMPSTRP